MLTSDMASKLASITSIPIDNGSPKKIIIIISMTVKLQHH